MALTTLTALKANLGITDSGEDTLLTQLLRQCFAAIRNHTKQYLGGVITSNTQANPTVITSVGHQLKTGDVITIANSNCSPTIDGERTVTKVSDDTFSVPVNVSAIAGTQGNFARVYTEYYDGSARNNLVLRQRPVRSISSVYEDSGGYWGQASGAFASDTQLTAGEDYALVLDDGSQSQSGLLRRIGAVWGGAVERSEGMLATKTVKGQGNIKATYTAGYVDMPWDVQLAAMNMVAELRTTVGSGRPISSQSLEDYSVSYATDAQIMQALVGQKSLLAPYCEVVW